MNEQPFDVAIIGGGLAGCSAAIHLAKRGHNVVLLETQMYPHDKVCGEFLSPECNGLLTNLGLTEALEAVHPAIIDTVSIIAPNGTTWTSTLPGMGLGISRYTLDELLAEQARASGVHVRTNTTVTDVQGNLADGFSLSIRNALGQQTLHAKAVIGAQGKRSNLDRKLDRPFFKKPQPFMALKAHFRGMFPSNQIHLYTFPGGYCGISQIEDGLINVCLLVRQDIFQSASQPSFTSVNQFIAWMTQQNPALGKSFANMERVHDSWLSISQIPFISKQVVVNDILMAGDSAGLIAPVAGDGMGMALQAGEMAADVLDLFLTQQLSAMKVRESYSVLWWQTFVVRLRLSSVLQMFMLHPKWLTSGLMCMNAVPTLGRLLVSYTRDKQLAHP
jgi:flavin-dependent dehydrogenase